MSERLLRLGKRAGVEPRRSFWEQGHVTDAVLRYGVMLCSCHSKHFLTQTTSKHYARLSPRAPASFSSKVAGGGDPQRS